MIAPNLRHVIASNSDVGRVRERNEDSCATWQDAGTGARPPRTLLVVADGMGGANAGDIASRMVVQTVVTPWSNGVEGDPLGVLRESFGLANEVVHARAAAEPELAGMGTTCTAVLAEGSSLWIAHVGDSRAYLVRGGRALQLTRDHSLVQDLVDRGELDPRDVRNDSRRNVLLRNMGMESKVAADVVQWGDELRPNDVLLLCSDGLHGELEDSEIARIANGHDPDTACRLLVELANKRGGRDNCTVVVLRAEISKSAATPGHGSSHRANGGRPLAWGALALGSLAVAALLSFAVLNQPRSPERHSTDLVESDSAPPAAQVSLREPDQASVSPPVDSAAVAKGPEVPRLAPAPSAATTESTDERSHLVVRVTPPADYRWSIDDELLTLRGAIIAVGLAAGSHRIQVRHPEYGEQTFTVDLPPGEEVEHLHDFAAAVTPGSLEVKLDGASDATLFIDGRRHPKSAPCTVSGLPVGTYLIEVEKPGFVSRTGGTRVEVSAGETQRVVFVLERTPESERIR